MQQATAVPDTTDVRAARRPSATRDRLIIFAAALMLRLVAGALFFGSVDATNSAENSIKLLAGQPVYLPYFPTINALIWFGGVLAATTPIPFTLCFKLVPILFDALLAVLIGDLVARSSPRLALWTGLLYAASPLALLMTCFHGQWDSIALFFLLLAFTVRDDGGRSRGGGFVFGALFGIGLLVKPIGLAFATLIPRRKGETTPYWPVALGLLATMACAFAAFEICGYSAIDAAGRIVWYGRGGASLHVFGLPYLPALAGLPLRENRLLWIVPAMGVLAILYHRGRLSGVDAMLTFYLLSLGTAAIAPQYLLWPLPFLLVSRRLRLAAVYSSLVTLFLVLFYANPWATLEHYSNAGVLAPLRSAAWLAPPALAMSPELLPLIQVLGNLVVPLCALTMAALVLYRRRLPEAGPRNWQGASGWTLRAAWYTAPVLPIAATLLLTRLRIDDARALPRLLEAWRAVPLRYSLHVHRLNEPALFAGDFGASSPVNVVVLLALLATIWCAAAVRISGRGLQAGPDSGD